MCKQNNFSKYISGDEWLIRERGWDPDQQAVCESVFSLGNGYLGSRGVLEEIPDGSSPGTYIAGIFDRSAAETTEIVNLPSPIDFQIYADGEKVAINQMDVTCHERILDMKKGLLVRRTGYRSRKYGQYEYRSLRAFSAADEHIALMRVYFTAMESDVDILIKNSIDASVLNVRQEMGTAVKHYMALETDQTDDIHYLSVKTNDSGYMVAYATDLFIRGDDKIVDGIVRTSEFVNDKFTENIRFKAEKGVVYSFEKIISLYTSREVPPEDIRDVTEKTLTQSRNTGFDGLLAAHIDSWHEKWSVADIVVDGDDINKALRFNLYHLLIAGSEHDDQVSIAPKALTSSQYNGHFFWDTELFVLPFFVFTNPDIARNLLMYRYHRLDEARRNARTMHFPGALFPWESADTGEEVTPGTWVNRVGAIVDVHTMEREHHIDGDVAYAVYQYHRATADDEFMLRYGAEIILETARFWAGRVVYNDKTGRYDIKDVIGPNEYQECVSNNAYTNYLARWNLRCAALLYTEFLGEYPEIRKTLCEKINLKPSEIDAWQRIADKIAFAVHEDGMIEEFAGYFKKRDVTIDKWNDHGMPIFPEEVPLPPERVCETQLVKQADVVMLLHLFHEDFLPDVKKMNLDYYERRTTHESSLSPCISAIVCTDVGDPDRAYRYFKCALYGDLLDNYGNTRNGIHAASLGGVWQAVVFGFAGVRMKGEILAINPRLPELWERLGFNLYWHGFKLNFDISRSTMDISFRSDRDITLAVEVCGRLYEVSGNSTKMIRYGN